MTRDRARRALLLPLALVFLLVSGAARPAVAEISFGLNSTLSADCDALTSGFAGEICTEPAGALYVCQPTAGACDTAGEWVLVSGGSGIGHEIRDEDVSVTQRAALNFVGASVAAVDDATPGFEKTDVVFSLDPVEVVTAYDAAPGFSAFADADRTKLDGIEAGATADQSAAEVPYSNATSGLAATELQAGLDELAATLAGDGLSALSITYAGLVAGSQIHNPGANGYFEMRVDPADAAYTDGTIPILIESMTPDWFQSSDQDPFTASAIDNGIAESGSTTTLTDTDKSWTVDSQTGHLLFVLGYMREITSNTATTLTFAPPIQTPISTEGYEIYAEDVGAYQSFEDRDFVLEWSITGEAIDAAAVNSQISWFAPMIWKESTGYISGVEISQCENRMRFPSSSLDGGSFRVGGVCLLPASVGSTIAGTGLVSWEPGARIAMGWRRPAGTAGNWTLRTMTLTLTPLRTAGPPDWLALLASNSGVLHGQVETFDTGACSSNAYAAPALATKGGYVHNASATALCEIDLPDGEVGDTIRIRRLASQTLRVDPHASDQIMIETDTVGDYLEFPSGDPTVDGNQAAIELRMFVDGEWQVESKDGGPFVQE